jgi:hypothetical protein
MLGWDWQISEGQQLFRQLGADTPELNVCGQATSEQMGRSSGALMEATF